MADTKVGVVVPAQGVPTREDALRHFKKLVRDISDRDLPPCAMCKQHPAAGDGILFCAPCLSKNVREKEQQVTALRATIERMEAAVLGRVNAFADEGDTEAERGALSALDALRRAKGE